MKLKAFYNKCFVRVGHVISWSVDVFPAHSSVLEMMRYKQWCCFIDRL